ncbi:MAG: helix-turn-helix transcriptional regulator [Chitinophagaceae bacterium]|nr:helix-turn-helix transcriptional regulator [Chitinophagaceae bacterium]
MQYSIKIQELIEPVLHTLLPGGFHDPLHPFSERHIVVFENAMGKGLLHELYFDNIHIAYEEMHLNRDIAIEGEADYEVVELHFELSGHSTRNTNGFDYSDFVAGSHNIVYAPAGKGYYQYSRLSRALEIHIPVPRFRRYAENMGTTLLDKFLKSIDRQEPTQISPHNMPVTPAMMQLINAILHCDKRGVYKRVFLEAKVMDLFLMQLEQLQAHRCSTSCLLRHDAVEKLHHAKDIALQNLEAPLSLSELAGMVGTNITSLKKGFKEVFGVSVFGLIAEVKMEKAKELLLSGQMNVSELSDYLGYSNVANFSLAFKRRFGVSPLKFVKG